MCACFSLARCHTLHVCACVRACVYVWIRNGWLWVEYSTKLKYHSPIQWRRERKKFNQCGTRHHTAAQHRPTHAHAHTQPQFSVLWCALLPIDFRLCLCGALLYTLYNWILTLVSCQPTQSIFSISFKIYNVYTMPSMLIRRVNKENFQYKDASNSLPLFNRTFFC